MKKWAFVYMVATILIASWAQSSNSVRIARLSYGTCETCLRLILHENAGIGLFTVSADGRRFYLKDAMGIVCVFNRQGQLIARFESPVPLDCVAVGPEGSIVSVGVCQPIGKFAVDKEPSDNKEPSTVRSSETEPSTVSSSEIEDETQQYIWVLKPDGKIDDERTKGFNTALESFLVKQQREYGDCFPEIAFFTGDRLGLMVMAPVRVSNTGEVSLSRESGLLILRQDGSWEGLYSILGASKHGALLECTKEFGLDAQQEWVRRTLDPNNQVEYRILEEDGTEYVRGKAPAHLKEPVKVRLRTGQTVSQEFAIQFQSMDGVLLLDAGARLDAQGRLYLPGWIPERHLRTLQIPGQEASLGLDDGYLIVRFTANGQFDRIVARLKMPIYGCRPWQLWDIDDVGNLYYLEFTNECIEIMMIPSESQGS
jgi:hypothetical protein